MEFETVPIPDELGMDSFSSFLASPQGIAGEGASSPLAIHVYSTLAKLHKHTLIPYLPRIMSSVLSSLSSSSQLHPACVQVVSALAVHTIDSSRDPASNEDTLRSLCAPLLSALLNPHPPLLSSGAASCLQSLVESDRWRCAPLDLQELVCAKGMQALGDEGMQTLAHMDLMRSLTKHSSGVVIQGYGVPLLGAGMDILQNSWDTEKRVSAAQLLESILEIADAELLDLDISPIMGVLQECQKDKVARVRVAAADALKMANSYETPLPAIKDQSTREGFPRLACKAFMMSPATVYSGMQDVRLAMGSTPCHGTLFSTPFSNKSVKGSRRRPLAPMQQSSMVNSTLVNPLRRRSATSKMSEYKENIAPAYSSRVPASRDVPRRARMSKRDSPFLWPQSSSRKNHTNWSLFDSPHTPIVPFCGELEAREGDSSVNTLLEKHFGKQNYLFESEIDVSMGDSASRTHHEESQCNYGGVCNSTVQDSGGCSPADSAGTDVCCGTEEIYSPNKESASDCESGITSDRGSSLQVKKNEALAEHLMMTPTRLVRILQFDDEYNPNTDPEKWMESDGGTPTESDAGTPDSAGCGMGASVEIEEDHCDVDPNSRPAPMESMSASEDYALFREGNTETNMILEGSCSTAKRRVRSVVPSEVQKAEKPGFVYLGAPCFEEDKAKQHYIQALSQHPVTWDEHEKVDGSTHNHSNMLAQHKRPISVCFKKLWRKASYAFLLVFCVGLLCTGLATYMESLQASNVLVPT